MRAWSPAKEPAPPHIDMNRILLGHGSGGKLTHDLIKDLFVRYFDNEYLSPLSDSAFLRIPGERIAFTTDSYVVNPIKFPGGDIGKLAICGTVNDLAVSGATPLYISCGFIIEEGLPFGDLEEIVVSMAKTAKVAGVSIVTGDTKVVEKGSADSIFINTAGIGKVIAGLTLGYKQIKPGDKIIINGNIGDHGMAVMSARAELGLDSDVISDCAPLGGLLQGLTEVNFMRDPTRGGVATTLCEIACESGFDIEIDESALPISTTVKGIAEILGIDPLFSANEGKVILVTPSESTDATLDKLISHPLGKNSRVIGVVKETKGGKVDLKTQIGTHRQITMLTGSQLPRIC